MASSREAVLTCVLSKLQANFDLPMPKTDPAYSAMVQDFTDLLMPFDRWELEDGVRQVILEAKSRHWPALGKVHAACMDRHKNGIPPERRNQPQLERPKVPERPPLPQHQRERIGYQLEVLREYRATGHWGTLEDCKAEAARRQAQNERNQAND